MTAPGLWPGQGAPRRSLPCTGHPACRVIRPMPQFRQNRVRRPLVDQLYDGVKQPIAKGRNAQIPASWTIGAITSGKYVRDGCPDPGRVADVRNGTDETVAS